MEVLIFATVISIIAIVVYKMIQDSKKGGVKKPVPKRNDPSLAIAMAWLEGFKTVSAGFKTRKDLDTYVRQQSVNISFYSKYPDFVIKYQEIYKKVADKF